ncbi:HATPase_c_3 domain-containing protein [Cephalotus follicularis]|uniref:HATPase_c_3 domain-containing protein n=1 Tax=Cephalotus follicularis TaxID=3775 RepID=A0A1Q3CMV6_CEPFO|nr:HATPase_c_3 domain-containing protein [Cephalotus follicularis]
MDKFRVKQEILDTLSALQRNPKRNDAVASEHLPVIDLTSSSSSSSSESDSDDDSDSGPEAKRARVWADGAASTTKKRKLENLDVVLPAGFLAPLPPEEPISVSPVAVERPQPVVSASLSLIGQSCKQFWKAGDYTGGPCGDWDMVSGGLDHVRVHPKFLHSNATSHKWALGAFAELLDNSLDEICYGATYVNVDMVESRKDGSRMLLVEDNGGGMNPDKMRHCMSLGYSAKSKVADTIGQYGNGFKTSTMRLGADVIVFSRSPGRNEKCPTQSIGLLSYTFLRSTGKEDIVVPMLDYEWVEGEWNKIIRSSPGDWNKNLETIVQWSPFSSEADLLRQFNMMVDRGTRIFIYNLWEDDQGQLELDFDADEHDIQLRGVNRDEKNIQMAKEYPNSRHFLTYRHSLRSYTSILYLRLPPGFRIILRGKDVEHHNIVNDMMLSEKITYRPQPGADGVPKDLNLAAVVTIGFVKDARFHIDVQGFNVYHKNRLVKPFWRLWNASGSDGRGVIGVLEANFVEPAHDKQGFERTTVLARLEARLVQMQKTYWSTNCHKIGYAPRRSKKDASEFADKGNSPDYHRQASPQSKRKSTPSLSKSPVPNSDKLYSLSNQRVRGKERERFNNEVDGAYGNGHSSGKGNRTKTPTKSGKRASSSELSSPSALDISDDDMQVALPERLANLSSSKTFPAKNSFGKDGPHTTQPSLFKDTEAQLDGESGGRTAHPIKQLQPKEGDANNIEGFLSESDLLTLEQLKRENQEFRERIEKKEGLLVGELLHELLYEKDRCKVLETELEEARKKIEQLNKEQESLIDIFSDERNRRDKEEENLRKRLKEASNTIQELVEKVRIQEKMRPPHHKKPNVGSTSNHYP